MGIDFTGCESIFKSLKYVKNKKNVLTLGRQGIHLHPSQFNYFLKKNNLPHLINKYNNDKFCEGFLKDLGFDNIDSLDNSIYEGASIIHNLNIPIRDNFKKYDYIIDCGTIEHIFNTPQVCENIINLLNIDGIFLSVTPNNNFSGHGIYQFSPEFYLSAFSKKYGMEVQELYLAKVGTGIDEWINVNSFGDGRNTTNFNTLDYVYIIAIIKKLCDNRENLITNPPNQYSYENIDWKM